MEDHQEFTSSHPIISNINEFFRDRCVFVTGSTGFMGKVLVEKLLRCCPHLKTIYLLIRPKKGQDVQGRLTREFYEHVMFDKLSREQPGVMSKITVLDGDISLTNLGLSDVDRELLLENVSVVFNLAATVRFNEDLRTAVQLNVKGVQQLLQTCHQIKHLEALIHVSTAFNNLDKKRIEEFVYPTTISPTKLLQLVDSLDDESLRKITEGLLGKCHNTYTFTKAIAEKLLEEDHAEVPTAIVRPSIVTAALKEPLLGWIDNINGSTGFFAGGGKGILRVARCNSQLLAEMIPVDCAINLMIAVAWYTATHNRCKEIKVFTCSTGQHNPITWVKVRDCMNLFFIKKPVSNMIWYPNSVKLICGKYAYQMVSFFYHYVPAYTLDFMATLFGRKARLVRLYIKIEAFISAISFFVLQERQFISENFIPLLDLLSAEDRRIFYFDVRQIEWQTYLTNYGFGIRRYIFKEKDDTIPAARFRLIKFRILQQMVTGIFLLLLAFTVLQLFF